MSSTPASSATGSAIQLELEAMRTLDQEFSAKVSKTRPARWQAIWSHVEGLKCFTSQPDGVPCASVEIDCEHCEELLTSLRAWRSELQQILQEALEA